MKKRIEGVKKKGGDMEAVYGWVKSIIYYMIFMSAANNLLADSKYEKYIRFFAGMVLILLVISPFTGGLRLDEQISAMFQSITFQNDAQDLKADLWGMEDKRLEQIMSSYEEAVKSDLVAMAEAEGLSCAQAQVIIDGDRDSSRYGQVTDIQMEVQREEMDEKDSSSYMGSRPVNVEGNQIGSIQVKPVALGDEESESKGGEGRGKEKPSRDKAAQGDGKPEEGALQSKIEGLTGKVANYYGLERSHIKVWWKND